jgi:hypothetical protein
MDNGNSLLVIESFVPSSHLLANRMSSNLVMNSDNYRKAVWQGVTSLPIECRPFGTGKAKSPIGTTLYWRGGHSPRQNEYDWNLFKLVMNSDNYRKAVWQGVTSLPIQCRPFGTGNAKSPIGTTSHCRGGDSPRQNEYDWNLFKLVMNSDNYRKAVWQGVTSLPIECRPFGTGNAKSPIGTTSHCRGGQ